ncbi:SNF2 family N-terminal domain-containing protein [Trichoderma velutinum]
MEAPASPPPAPSAASHLLSPASSPKPDREDPELSGLDVPVQTLGGVDDGISTDKDQDAFNLEVELPTPPGCVSNDESSLFMDEDTIEEDQQTINTDEIETAGTAANPPLSPGSIELQVTSILAFATSEENELESDILVEESEDSEYEESESHSSEDDCEHTEKRSNRTQSAKKLETKVPRKRAANAREFVAHLQEEERRKYELVKQKEEDGKHGAKRPRKRKIDSVPAESRKALKAADGSFLAMFNNGSATSDGNPLIPAQSITATTHAEQLAQMKADIPEGFDTRRTRTQEQDLKEAKSLFGYKRVEAINGLWKLKGMKTPMKSHQLTAVAWMVKRELALMEPFGGILADDMGMGKTIMSLACIIGNRPDTKHQKEFCNATLVVVQNKTAALQWEGEASRHWDEPYNEKVFIYDKQREDLVERCKTKFIVITTYKELMSQYPNMTAIRKLREKYHGDSTSLQHELDKLMGNLFHINWYRIILDEAHAIKNYDGATARACFALMGKYRWALSGTPLANSSDEMFSYMKFLNCQWTVTHKEFRSFFFKGTKPNAEFEAFTSVIMCRRTTNDAFLGHPIINLPERKVVDLWVPLSIEEQIVVDAVSEFYKKKTALLEMGELQQATLNEEIENVIMENEQRRKGKNVKKGYTKSIRAGVMMLGRASQVRKRQAISHVFCIEPLLRRSFSTSEVAELCDRLEELQNKRTILEQMQVNAEQYRGIAQYEVGLKILQQQEENFFGKYFDMEKLLDILGDESMVRDATCPLCEKQDSPKSPRFSNNCGHLYCSECIVTALANTTTGQIRTRRCLYKDCDKRLGLGKEANMFQKIIDKAGSKDSGYREPGRDCLNASIHQDDDRNGFFISSTFCDAIPILPSTKLTATMAVILTWLDEAPDDKILVFTQWTGAAKMLGLMLQTMDIGFVYYYGGLATPQKSRALEAIRKNKEIKVMISTLKSGGQSLNLTVANRVIIIDPWWNKTAEQQAFGRVVRIGQEKVTHLVNIKTKEPIDYRIYRIQEEKAKDVDRTLQDDGHTPHHVSPLELQSIFERANAAKEERRKKKQAAA